MGSLAKGKRTKIMKNILFTMLHDCMALTLMYCGL